MDHNKDHYPVGISTGSIVPQKMCKPSKGSFSSPPNGEQSKKTNAPPKKSIVKHTSYCKISDNLADSCKTLCKICGDPFFLMKMRSHTIKYHGIQITKYKEMYGPFEIIEKVFHKCHLCGKIVLMDSDVLGGHIKKTHKMKEKDYKEKYCYTIFIINEDLSVKSKLTVFKEPSGVLNLPVNHSDQTNFVRQLNNSEKKSSENTFGTQFLYVDKREATNKIEKLSEEKKDPQQIKMDKVGQDELIKGIGEKVGGKEVGKEATIGEQDNIGGLGVEAMYVQLSDYLNTVEQQEAFIEPQDYQEEDLMSYDNAMDQLDNGQPSRELGACFG